MHDLVIDAADNAFLILEYVPGGTLYDRLYPGRGKSLVPLPVAEALRLTADAARGLRDLHDADLVHRDIKPENLFIAANGWAKVGGLGIVQMSTTTFRTRVDYGSERGHPGTPMSMSPEQANTTDVLMPEADQYSLGCVLFELVTGKRYKGVYADERGALLAALPAGLAGLIRTMTAERPGERYRGMDAVLAAIGALDRNETLPVPPPLPRPAPTPSPTPTPHLDEGMTRHETRPLPSDPPGPVGPPPVLPAPRPVSRRAVLAGIGGVVVAGGAAGGAWALSHRGDGTVTATPPPAVTSTVQPIAAPVTAVAAGASPTPVPATVTPISPAPTALPTATSPPPTVTPRPSAASITASGMTWVHPNGLVKPTLASPKWHADSFYDFTDSAGFKRYGFSQNDRTGVGDASMLEFFTVKVRPPQGTPIEEMRAFREASFAANPPLGPVDPDSDVRIGDEPGRFQYFNYPSTDKDKRAVNIVGATWIVDHQGQAFLFNADYEKTRADVDAMIASVIFLK